MTATISTDNKRINYKSDFDFIARLMVSATDGTITDIGFPSYDWEMRITSGCNGYTQFVASAKSGKLKNCVNDNGQIRIVCDNHGLRVGKLHAEFYAYLPNDIYPDGEQLVVTCQDLGIELVAHDGETDTSIETELQLPIIVVDDGVTPDLSNYLLKVDAEQIYAKKDDIPIVPSKVSELTNDTGYVTENHPYKYISETESKYFIKYYEEGVDTIIFDNVIENTVFNAPLLYGVKVSLFDNGELLYQASFLTQTNIKVAVESDMYACLLVSGEALFIYDAKEQDKTLTSVSLVLTPLVEEVDFGYSLTTPKGYGVADLYDELEKSIPQKTSQLTNDSSFITLADVPEADLSGKQDVLTAGDGITIENNVITCTLDTSLYKVVVSLPEKGEDNKIYLIESNEQGEQNIYTEYGYINNAWEKLGEYRAEVNLAPYITKEEAEATYQPIGDYALNSDLPTKVSELENDNSYITANDIPDAETYVLNFTIADGVNSGSYSKEEYDKLRAAITAGKLIIIGGTVTRVTADSQAMATDYVVIRYSTPRIGDDNTTITISFYELRFGILTSGSSEYEYASKAIHKTIT